MFSEERSEIANVPKKSSQKKRTNKTVEPLLKRLRESEERSTLLEGIADALPVLIASIDRNFRYRFNNAAYKRWFHLKKEALVGKHVREVLGQAAWLTLKPHMSAALRGERRSFERSVPYKGVGVREVQVDYVPQRDRSGKVAGVYALIRDVTERKKLELDLRRSRENLAKAQRIASLGSYEHEIRRGGKSFWSEEALRLIGRRSGRLTPAIYIGQIVHPDDRSRVRQARGNAIRAGEPYRIEYRIRKPGGAVRWMQCSGEPKRDKSGTVVGVSGTLVDITERKRLERSIAHVAEAEQRRIARDLHDGLGQLLSGTMYLASGLAERLRGADSALEIESLRVVQLLEQALSQTRQLARGLYPVRDETGGLRAALEELARSTEGMFRVQCRLKISKVPEIHSQAVATHIYRIIQEAVQNAVRHGKGRRISIFLGGRGPLVLLSVRDDGIGLTRGAKKNGMGLQIMRSRAGILGGTLSVVGRDHAGTRVACLFRKTVLTNNTEENDGKPF